MAEILLQADRLCAAYGKAQVVSDVSLYMEKGEILALVGESGCGKSSVSLALTRLLPPSAKISAEKILFTANGETADLSKLPEKKLRKFRGGKIAYIFQEPSVSLNPVITVGEQIAEVLTLHRPEIKDQNKEIITLLEQVGIPDAPNRVKAYPHELSGGMQQRIMIAMALAGDPQLLVADEPTTALDVTVQAQILELLQKLRKERQMAVLLISHNLGVVGALADRIAVMYAGQIVECAPAKELISSPRHPYTKALLAAVPVLGKECGRLETISGFVPAPDNWPAGCRFAPRCPYRTQKCDTLMPESKELSPGHICSCFMEQGDL
ncbi:MAG: ABC transporter ATP-binding protein [Lentisphaerae bacterium]|nr:ABC transporter ATP-binding protein [Lentisphaerota bacterium]